jgi:co-chaperonin GroES (HSP10)
MRAVGHTVIIRPIEQQMETSFGMTLSAGDKTDIRYQKATVVSVGHLVTEHIVEGATVWYDTRAGFSMVSPDGKLTVIGERDIPVIE